jgi:hypothetical protein
MVNKRSNHQNEKIHKNNNKFKKRLRKEASSKTKQFIKKRKTNDTNELLTKEANIKKKNNSKREKQTKPNSY